MTRWKRIRLILQAIAGGTGAATLSCPPGKAQMILAAITGGLIGLAKDLPRDPWPKERRDRLNAIDDYLQRTEYTKTPTDRPK